MAFYMCPRCGADIDLDDTNKCEFCGNELNMVECIECGKEIPADANICPYCDAEQSKETKEDFVSGKQSDEETEETEPEDDKFLSDIENAIESDIPVEDEGVETEADTEVEEYSEPEFAEESIETEKEQEEVKEPEPEEIEEDTGVISNVTMENEAATENQEEEDLDFGHREEIEEIIEEPGIEEDIIEEEEEIVEEDEYLESIEDIDIDQDEEMEEEEYPEEESIEEDFVGEVSEDEEFIEATEEADIEAEKQLESESEEAVVEKQSEEAEVEKQTTEEKEEVQLCPECEAENPSMAKFCLSCGAKLETPQKEEKKNICPECGTENLENAKFCMVCGTNLTEEPSAKEEQKDKKEAEEEKIKETEQYKVKVKYDKNNKFKYRFVKNKINEVKPEINDNELETLMSNNNFVLSIPASKFKDFKMELEELDCEVNRIDEGQARTNESEKETTKEVKKVQKVYVVINELPEEDENWQSKFVSMLNAMRPDITKDEAEKISEGEEKKIEVKNKEDGEQLSKVLSALNCKTEIIEKKEEIKTKDETEESSDDKQKEKKEEEKEIEQELEREMQAKMKEKQKETKEETEEEKEEVKEEEKPKFLILSGVDKNNWVVRERLLEKLVQMYPNMTRDIAEGIVTQPVVKLRVKNLKEAEKYKPEFEDMGWNTRIEDVSKMLKARKAQKNKNVNVQKRKQIHQAYLKREKSKRKNILTTILIAIFILGIGYFVYSSFFVAHNYMLVEADVGNSEVELSTSGNPVVHLRKNPRMDSSRVGVPIQVGSVLELEREEPIAVGGYQWYEVKVPGVRGRTGYIRGDIVIPSDKDGNPVSESP